MTLHPRIRKVTPGHLLRAAPSAPSLPNGLVAEVLAAWASAGRHYHSAEHLLEIAGWYEVIANGPGWRKPLEVWLAMLFHDAIYEVGAADNESRSAELASRAIHALSLIHI